MDWRGRTIGILTTPGPLVEGQGIFPHGSRQKAEAGREDRHRRQGSRNKRFLLTQKVILFSTSTPSLLSQASQVKKRK